MIIVSLHAVEARFVAWMVVTTRDHMAAFRPDDLRADLKARGDEGVMDDVSKVARVPDIRDGRWGNRPDLSPVRAVIIEDFPHGDIGFLLAMNAFAPARVIAHSVGRIGHHEVAFFH